jgi:hypothetical protein
MRRTAAATLLMGGLALGALLSGQAGRILNLFSAKSVTPPSVSLTDKTDEEVRVRPATGYVGNWKPTQRGGNSAGIAQTDLPTRRLGERLGEVSQGRSDYALRLAVADLQSAGSATGLRASADLQIGIDFAAPSNTPTGTASAVGNNALPNTGADLARAGAQGWAASASPASNPFSFTQAAAPASLTPVTVPVSSIPVAAPPSAPTGGASSPPAPSAPASPAPRVAVAVLPTTFVQTSGKTIIDTLLSRDTVDIIGGRLGGHGTIQAATVTIGAGATLGPGNSPGVLTINGNLLQLGELEIEIAGKSTVPVEYDVLHVTGDVTFAPGSLLKFVLYPIYSPSSGDAFEFLTANSISGIDNLAFAIAGLPSDFRYQVYEETQNGESDLYVRFSSQAQATASPQTDEQIVYVGTAVPDPSTMALAVLGLALLGWRLRRRAA